MPHTSVTTAPLRMSGAWAFRKSRSACGVQAQVYKVGVREVLGGPFLRDCALGQGRLNHGGVRVDAGDVILRMGREGLCEAAAD